jgi:hypothetical protein
MKFCLRKLGSHPSLARALGLGLALGVLGHAGVASADTAVMPVEGRNLTAGDSEAIGRLFADAYATTSQERVVAPRPTDPDADFALVPADEAKRVGANEYVVIYAVGLGEKVKLRATRYALDGTVIHTVNMDAASLDDLDVVTERMAKALWLEVTPRETRTPETVTAQEGRAPNRVSTEKVVGVKTSYIQGFATDLKLGPLLGVGFDDRLEGESYFIEFGAGLLLPAQDYNQSRGNYGGAYAEFGASYYLSNGETSPYVGAGVLPRFIITDHDAGTQLSVYGQAGVMFMRSSSTRLYLDARVAQSVTPVRFETQTPTSDPYSSTSVHPLEVGLEVGIGW